MSATIVQSGEYDLLIDTGFALNGMRLDDPVKGILSGYTTMTTRTNLMLNPNFEVDTVNWAAVQAGTTITRITTDDYIGTASLQIDVTGLIASARAQTSTVNRMPVTVGLPYMISAWVKVPTGQPSVSLRIRTAEYTAAGVNQQSQISAATVVSDTDGWVRLSYSDTPISGTVTMLMGVEISNAPGSARRWLVDAVLFEQSASLLPYFDGTYADPYSGYTLTSQQWNDVPDNSSSTATWGLNTSYIDTEYILNGNINYASVIDGATNISVFRGRRDIGDQGILAGTMSFELLDTTGIFNPFDDQGPYFDPSNNQPGLAPLRRVILSRENEVLFKGYITTYSYSFELGELDRVSVNCADDFYYLAQTYLDEWNVSEQLSSDRVTDLLDLPEVNFPALERNISTGTVTLGGASAYTVANGTSVANYAAQIQQAEQGRIFIDRNGNFTFQPRLGNTLGGSVIDFHDNGAIGTAGYDAVGIAFDADQVVNRASVEHLGGGSPQVAEDLASQAQYLIQTTSITGSLLHNNAAALALAEYLLVPNPEPRFTEVSVAFVSLTEAQRDLAAVVDIGDTITIQKSIQQGATSIEFAQELAVEGVQHQINVLSGHRVTFYTSPTTIVYELILDSAQYGRLDALNVVG